METIPKKSQGSQSIFLKKKEKSLFALSIRKESCARGRGRSKRIQKYQTEKGNRSLRLITGGGFVRGAREAIGSI